jgi:outer membrane protein
MLNKKLLGGAALAVLLSGTAFAQDDGLSTDAGTIELRARGLVVVPEDNSSSISVVGGHVDASTTAVPEVDLSYFLSKNIAIEAIAAVTPHTVKANNTAAGNLTVGDVWLLPPTVTLQYHFGNGGTIDPYLGAGLNYTWFFGESHKAPFTSVSYDDNVGGAFQAGVDVSLGGGWVANVDVKQLILSTTAHTYVGATPINAKVDLDPLLAGVGIGYRWGATPTPAAYVPPPAAPAALPAPPPAAPVEAKRSFQVFFDFNKSDITGAAAKVIQSAADTVRAGGFAHIDVTGHTDTVGSAAYNQKLSEARAAAVKARLIADGVAGTEISTIGVGKTGLLVPTADGVREAQNRRAEIELK